VVASHQTEDVRSKYWCFTSTFLGMLASTVDEGKIE